MCKEYSIFFNGFPVGTAALRENGLYYRIEAACRPDNNRMLRLKAYCADNVIDLGLLVPEDDLFVLCKDIPIKLIKSKDIRFHLQDRDAQLIQIRRNEPFPYLHCLERLKITILSQKKYIDSGALNHSSNNTGQ